MNWSTRADISEAMAAALADPDLDEQIVELTGSETVDLAGVAAIASELSGRPIRRTVVPDDEFRDGLLARGVPPEQLIGQPPTTMREVLRAALAG